MSTFAVLGLVFGIVAAIFALLTPFALRSALRMKREGATTSAVVTEMEDVAQEGWIAHIRYQVEGRPYILKVGSTGRYRVGEDVRVRYLRAEPSRSTVDSAGHIWLETGGAAGAAVIFAGVALLMFALDRWL